MKTGIFYIVAGLLVAFSGVTYAQTSTIKGGTCFGALGNLAALSSTMSFTCQHLGTVTISQIYEKGFRVVSTINHTPNGYVSLVIEEQRH